MSVEDLCEAGQFFLLLLLWTILSFWVLMFCNMVLAGQNFLAVAEGKLDGLSRTLFVTFF